MLTPEEFVRQNFVNWLINSLGYPSSLLKNEFTINLNNTIKRCDTVLFLKNGSPRLIIEYKAPNIKINHSTFSQIVRYNYALNAEFLILSNGVNHYCCKVDIENHTYKFLDKIPNYLELKELEENHD